MGYLRAFRIGSSALSAQRLRLDTIANNVANAETTRTDTGKPYQRKDVVFRALDRRIPFADMLLINRTVGEKALSLNGVEVSKIVTDDTPGTKVFSPSHPDADEDGYVTYPNVNLVVEMTNMLSATRSYEANLSIVNSARVMAQRALEIGR
ncbi:MAG: flagellar basal body rod protein FlgC [Anaerolineae bacterium]|nr:flagellar basal body rod protein FlgC [Anaerolineae bacterium]